MSKYTQDDRDCWIEMMECFIWTSKNYHYKKRTHPSANAQDFMTFFMIYADKKHSFFRVSLIKIITLFYYNFSSKYDN